jgi:hypothetical protein
MRSASEQLNSSDHSHPKTCVWLFVMVLGVSSGISAAAIEGDVELLKRTALMIRENHDRIQYWQGSAAIESRMVDLGGDLLSTKKSRVQYWTSTDANAIRWSMVYDDYKNRATTDDAFYTGETGKTWDEMKKGDRFYRYRDYFTTPAGDRKNGLTIWPLRKPRFHVYTTTFDPYWYLTNKGMDMCDRLLFFYDEVDNPNLTPIKIWQTASLVFVETRSVERTTTYTLDHAKGGNLIKYENISPTGIERTTWEYEEKDGVWVPKEFLLTHSVDDDSYGFGDRRHKVTFTKNIVNVPIDPSEFTLESLGLKPGERISDTIQGTGYSYEKSGSDQS